jgi:hypothetical protein
MNSITRNILDFYKHDNNEANIWYLKKNFTNKANLGLYSPYAKNAVAKEWDGKVAYIGTIDEDNTYEINGAGFRGEFYKNPEIIASGCSITFGLGVPELGRWTNILGNKINKNVMNLGSPGASIESICNTIIQYCMNNKMPKEIFCLMPDFFRRMVVVDKEFYKSKVDRGSIGTKNNLEQIFCNPTVQKNKDYIFMEIENNKYIEDATSPHQLILNSINYIYILESFCSTNNIKLYWTTWDVSTAMIMDELIKLEDFKLNNYTSFATTNLKNADFGSVPYDCNISHDSEFYGSIYWHRGTDYSMIKSKKVSDYAHPGIHFQYHFADFFYKLHNLNVI